MFNKALIIKSDHLLKSENQYMNMLLNYWNINLKFQGVLKYLFDVKEVWLIKVFVTPSTKQLNINMLCSITETSQVTYVTLVPRGNETLRRNARGTPSALSSSESYV